MKRRTKGASEKPRRTRKAVPSGALVEGVRLIFVALFTFAGWEIAGNLTGVAERLWVGIVLGSATGYVIGGVFGRQTHQAVSEATDQLERLSPQELLGGSIGSLIGLAIAFLLTFPLFRLPPAAAYPFAAFIYVTLAVLGYRVGRGSRRAKRGAGASGDPRNAAASVLDTSVLLDGRLLDVVRAGFLWGKMVVPRAVLEELQSAADASEPARRGRGRLGLDAVESLRAEPFIEVEILDAPVTGEVDSYLVSLAKERDAAIVTNDSGLAKVASALGVPVRSLHALSRALGPNLVPGEEITLRLTREGRDRGQGVGFLEDGTMVVVENGASSVGSEVTTIVSNVLKTASGRMVFARLEPES